jgi:hypothetical protein
MVDDLRAPRRLGGGFKQTRGAFLANLGALHFREAGTAVLRLPAGSFKKGDS